MSIENTEQSEVEKHLHLKNQVLGFWPPRGEKKYEDFYIFLGMSAGVDAVDFPELNAELELLVKILQERGSYV